MQFEIRRQLGSQTRTINHSHTAGIILLLFGNVCYNHSVLSMVTTTVHFNDWLGILYISLNTRLVLQCMDILKLPQHNFGLSGAMIGVNHYRLEYTQVLIV